jgi:hypothetical protein
MGFRVRNIGDGTIVPGLPTPRLIENGGGEAYFVPNADRDARGRERVPGIWYLRDTGYESPDGTYKRVRIEHTEDWRVDVRILPVLDGDIAFEEAYDDYFIVDAATEQEAFRLAETAAHEDVQHRYGAEYGSEVTIIRARRGVSI